jgi:hypothetical protein
MKSEIKHRVSKGKQITGALRNIWKGVSRDLKRSMYEGIVVQTLLYGSEMWTANTEDRRWMSGMKIKCMRAMCRVPPGG